MHNSSAPLSRTLLLLWPTKVWLGTVLFILFYGGYFYLNHHPSRQPAHLALTAIDRWIGFSPHWIWGYLSLYLMLPLGWLASTRDELVRYAAGIVSIMLIGFGCFLIWPVDGPRPPLAPSAGLYGWLISFDRPLNSFPSLHLALATYSMCIGLQMTVGRLKRDLSIVLSIWVVLIGLSTLGTKQHYAVDLPPGIFLGWMAWRIAWRNQPRDLSINLPVAVASGVD